MTVPRAWPRRPRRCSKVLLRARRGLDGGTDDALQAPVRDRSTRAYGPNAPTRAPVGSAYVPRRSAAGGGFPL